MQKNKNSVDNYHIVSNLTKKQYDDRMAYDGMHKDSTLKKSTYTETLDLSERLMRKEGLKENRR